MSPTVRRLALALTALAGLALATPAVTLAWLHHGAAGRIATDPADLPALPWACVMGARVYGPGDPSPVALQRVEAAAALARVQPALRLVVSGHEPANQEATALALALVGEGVDPTRIRIDPAGASTLANVRAMEGTRGPVVFVSQGYHLPRTLWLARREGLDAWGLAAEAVAPTDPGTGRLGTIRTRGWRHLREAGLALLHLAGRYEAMTAEPASPR